MSDNMSLLNIEELPAHPASSREFAIVVIGSSADGIEATTQLLAAFPPRFAAAVLVVVHRPVERISYLHEILARSSQLEVVIAEEGQVLREGVCYVSRSHQHMIVDAELRLHLMADGFYRGHNIDALLCSVAVNAGRRSIGVILTGMRKDGALGLWALKQAGGIALIQDPVEAGYAEMPRSAIYLTLNVDLVAPVAELARDICSRVGLAKPHVTTAMVNGP